MEYIAADIKKINPKYKLQYLQHQLELNELTDKLKDYKSMSFTALQDKLQLYRQLKQALHFIEHQ